MEKSVQCFSVSCILHPCKIVEIMMLCMDLLGTFSKSNRLSTPPCFCFELIDLVNKNSWYHHPEISLPHHYFKSSILCTQECWHKVQITK